MCAKWWHNELTAGVVDFCLPPPRHGSGFASRGDSTKPIQKHRAMNCQQALFQQACTQDWILQLTRQGQKWLVGGRSHTHHHALAWVPLHLHSAHLPITVGNSTHFPWHDFLLVIFQHIFFVRKRTDFKTIWQNHRLLHIGPIWLTWWNLGMAV